MISGVRVTWLVRALPKTSVHVQNVNNTTGNTQGVSHPACNRLVLALQVHMCTAAALRHSIMCSDGARILRDVNFAALNET